MPRNIELKARLLQHRDTALAACASIGASFQGDIRQTDTYFPVRNGRLKLRESDPGEDYLVFYQRPDLSGPKGCDYLIQPVPRTIRPLLAASLGTLAVVEKSRTLYLWQNVRIHLDLVNGLGSFIEFEAVLDDRHDDADGFQKLSRLQQIFQLSPEDLLKTSYLEMILAVTQKESLQQTLFCKASPQKLA